MGSKSVEVNYLFFGIISFCLIIGYIFNICFADPNNDKLLFSCYSIGQILLESALFIFLISRFEKKKNIFASIFFIIFLSHTIDIFLVRIADMSVGEGLGIAFHESVGNFIEMMSFLNFPITIWVGILLFIFIVPLIGPFLYKRGEIYSFKIGLKPFFATILSIFLFLLFLNFKSVSYEEFIAYQKSLPWKTTIFTAKPERFQAHLKKEGKNEIPILKGKSPNIYLFIVESLRKDIIREDITPNLYRFQKENISFATSLSNANNSHQSWCSILTSKIPFYWRKIDGSDPLKILKKAGYKVNVYAGAQIAYYDMDRRLFGENRYIANFFYFAPHYTDKAYVSDKKTMTTLASRKGYSNNINIIFLDSTHFEYSLPDDFCKFRPCAGELAPFFSRSSILKLKNRYFNAVNYVDSLLGQFLESIKDENDAIVIITSDHGEEFWEHGNFFHCSRLSPEQTSVPILYKFGRNLKKVQTDMTSHVDIFPSIFDYLYGYRSDMFDGESIFQKRKWHYSIATRYYSSRRPYEFFIHNGKEKLILHYKKSKLTPISLQKADGTILKDEKVKKDLLKSLDRFFDLKTGSSDTH